MSKPKHLQFYDPAPDPDLISSTGQPGRLSHLWASHPLLVAFTRHFGCPQCKEMLTELVQAQSELENAGLTVTVVTQANPAETNAFCQRYAPGLICYSDPTREAYRAYGLGRGRLWETILSLRVLQANEQVRRVKGWKAELPPRGQDALLMSGIFIIGKDGRIRLPYYYDNIADHPPLDLLLHGVLGVGWDKPFEGPISRKMVDHRG